MYLCQICKKEGLQAATIVYPFKIRNTVCKVNALKGLKRGLKLERPRYGVNTLCQTVHETRRNQQYGKRSDVATIKIKNWGSTSIFHTGFEVQTIKIKLIFEPMTFSFSFCPSGAGKPEKFRASSVRRLFSTNTCRVTKVLQVLHYKAHNTIALAVFAVTFSTWLV